MEPGPGGRSAAREHGAGPASTPPPREQERKLEQEKLSGVVKSVHRRLRKKYREVGDFDKIWREHCEDEETLCEYAVAMKNLADNHWAKTCEGEGRIEWCCSVCREYFQNGGKRKALEKDEKRAILGTKTTPALNTHESSKLEGHLTNLSFTNPEFITECAVDRHPTDININLTILCSDSNGKNSSSARILQIIKGKDYESEPSLLEFKPFSNGPLVGGFVYRGCQSERLYGSYVFGDRNGNFLTLQQSPVSKQWQEKPLCLGNGGSCRGYFSGHILGFGEDELGEVYILSSSKSMTQTHNGKLYKIIDPKRPLMPEECRAVVQPAQTLTSECSRLCRNGYCTPTGTCCCSPGWEGDFCRIAKCEPACCHGGVCVRPNKCLCKKGYLGAQCEQVDRNLRRVTRAGILDQIIDMTSYLLDLTSYIV